MILLSPLRLLLFLLVGAAVTVLEILKGRANDKDIGATFSSTSSSLLHLLFLLLLLLGATVTAFEAFRSWVALSLLFSKPFEAGLHDHSTFPSLSKLGCMITPLFETFRSWAR